MKRRIYFFHDLQWKLMRSYALATLIALCCFVLSITVLSDFYYAWNEQPKEEQQTILHYLSALKANTILYLTHNPGQPQNVQAWLEQQVGTAHSAAFFNSASSREQLRFMSIIDPGGYVLASIGPDAVPPKKMLRAYLSPSERRILAYALQVKFTLKQNLFVEQAQTQFIVEPLADRYNTPIGALLAQIYSPPLIERFIYKLTTDFALLIPQDLLGIVLGVPLFVCVCVFFSRSIIRRVEGLFSMQKQSIAAEERNHLARDLHDSIKQQFYALGAQIQIANELYLQPHRIQTHLQDATLLLQNIQEEMNNLIQHLRPATLTEKGLKNAMQDYVQSWSRLYGILITFIYDSQNDEDIVPLDQDQEEALFRVMQEALSNVARHSGALWAKVCLSRNRQGTILSIIDNGHGFDPGRIEPGVGLSSMQERLHALGGTVKISRTPERETAIVASFKHVGKTNRCLPVHLSLVLEHLTRLGLFHLGNRDVTRKRMHCLTRLIRKRVSNFSNFGHSLASKEP